jgi:predicted PurR-regulated permease PerM
MVFISINIFIYLIKHINFNKFRKVIIVSSRSATVLVIFIVAVIAFCFASVFASMTGPISILPNESQSGGVLDNLSALTDDNSNENTYNYQEYNDYSEEDTSHDDSKVETTTDDSSDSNSHSSNSDSNSDSNSQDSSKDSGSAIETTTDSSSDSSKNPIVETTTG